MTSDALNDAIVLCKSGKKDEARPILKQLLREDPHNEIAWIWLIEALPGQEERRKAAEMFLRQCPQSNAARQANRAMQPQPAVSDPQPGLTGEPGPFSATPETEVFVPQNNTYVSPYHSAFSSLDRAPLYDPSSGEEEGAAEETPPPTGRQSVYVSPYRSAFSTMDRTPLYDPESGEEESTSFVPPAAPARQNTFASTPTPTSPAFNRQTGVPPAQQSARPVALPPEKPRGKDHDGLALGIGILLLIVAVAGVIFMLNSMGVFSFTVPAVRVPATRDPNAPLAGSAPTADTCGCDASMAYLQRVSDRLDAMDLDMEAAAAAVENYPFDTVTLANLAGVAQVRYKDQFDEAPPQCLDSFDMKVVSYFANWRQAMQSIVDGEYANALFYIQQYETQEGEMQAEFESVMGEFERCGPLPGADGSNS